MSMFLSTRPIYKRPLVTTACKLLGTVFIVVSLSACDQLARFTSRPDASPVSSETASQAARQAPEQGQKKAEQSTVPELAPPKPKKPPLYEWADQKRPVTRIVINTDEQKARFYSDGEEVGWSTVATGVSKHPTPTGSFQIMSKQENKRSNLYGKVKKNGRVIKTGVKVGRDRIPTGGTFEGARMPYFMRLTYDGIGLHAGPIPRPGRAASHGCIRMPKTIAHRLFKSVSNGTPVVIEGSGPSYGNYVEKQRVIAARMAEERRQREARRKAEAARQRQLAQAEAAKVAAASSVMAGPAVARPHLGTNPLAQWPASQPTTVVDTAGAQSASDAAAITSTQPPSLISAMPKRPGPTLANVPKGSSKPDEASGTISDNTGKSAIVPQPNRLLSAPTPATEQVGNPAKSSVSSSPDTSAVPAASSLQNAPKMPEPETPEMPAARQNVAATSNLASSPSTPLVSPERETRVQPIATEAPADSSPSESVSEKPDLPTAAIPAPPAKPPQAANSEDDGDDA